jgi:hypothetical protein
MKYGLLALSALGIGLVGLEMGLAQQGANSKIAAQKGWLTSLDQAKAQAQKTGKPLLVVFRCEP